MVRIADGSGPITWPERSRWRLGAVRSGRDTLRSRRRTRHALCSDGGGGGGQPDGRCCPCRAGRGGQDDVVAHGRRARSRTWLHGALLRPRRRGSIARALQPGGSIARRPDRPDRRAAGAAAERAPRRVARGRAERPRDGSRNVGGSAHVVRRPCSRSSALPRHRRRAMDRPVQPACHLLRPEATRRPAGLPRRDVA